MMLVPRSNGMRSMTAGAVGALARISPSNCRHAVLACAASVMSAISSIRFIVGSSRKSE